MFRRSYSLIAVLPLAFAVACGDKTDGGVILTGATNTVLVRFINASTIPITVNNGGVVVSGSSNLVFGATSSCVPVDVTNLGALTFTSNGTALTGFSANFAPTGPFAVVAFNGTNNTTQFGVINTNVTPTSGSAALQVFNAATGTTPLTILADGTALSGGTVTFGSSTNFLTVPTGSAVHLTATAAGAQVADLGTFTFTAGQTQTLVIGPPATGTTNLRPVTANGC
jgi:hypothetical protein